MGFVAEARDGDIDQDFALDRLDLGIFHRPTDMGIFLARLGGLVRPDLDSRLSLLDRGLLAIAVALAWGRDQGRIHDLATARQEPRDIDRMVEALEEVVQDIGPDQGLAKIPGRIGIGHRIGQAQPARPHPAQPVPHQALVQRAFDPPDRMLLRFTLEAQPMKALQHQHAKFQHHIRRGATTLRARVATAARSRIGRNISKSTVRFRTSSGSPPAETSDSRSSTLQNPSGRDIPSLASSPHQ